MDMFARQSNVIMTILRSVCLLYTLIPVQKGTRTRLLYLMGRMQRERIVGEMFFRAYFFRFLIS
jgi:hypothetical protein